SGTAAATGGGEVRTLMTSEQQPTRRAMAVATAAAAEKEKRERLTSQGPQSCLQRIHEHGRAPVADGYEERPFASRSDVVIAGMVVAEILEGLSGLNLGWEGMELETGASLFLRTVTDEDTSPGETLYREELICREHMSVEDRWDM